MYYIHIHDECVWKSCSSYFKMEQSRGSIKSFSIVVSSVVSNGCLSVLWRVFFRHKLSYGSVHSRIRSYTSGEETRDGDSSLCGSICQYTMLQTNELVVCYKLHQKKHQPLTKRKHIMSAKKSKRH